jgi:hypothetical protein
MWLLFGLLVVTVTSYLLRPQWDKFRTSWKKAKHHDYYRPC